LSGTIRILQSRICNALKAYQDQQHDSNKAYTKNNRSKGLRVVPLHKGGDYVPEFLALRDVMVVGV
jgi:hypothetical protein